MHINIRNLNWDSEEMEAELGKRRKAERMPETTEGGCTAGKEDQCTKYSFWKPQEDISRFLQPEKSPAHNVRLLGFTLPGESQFCSPN